MLQLDGTDLCDKTYRERREVLEGLELRASHWDTPAVHIGSGARYLLEASMSAGLEGLVAKRLDSSYARGERTRYWLKYKNWQRQEMVVGGWKRDADGQGGWLGALLVGIPEDSGTLRYVGSLDTGIKGESLQALRELLPALEADVFPFSSAPSGAVHYVQPRLRVEVQFLGWTSSGKARQPLFRGFAL